MFEGFVNLGDTIAICVLTASSGVPTDADALPTYRVYDDDGIVLTGTAALKDSGNISDATNASPIVITSTGHGLNTGTQVEVASVSGNTAANGTFTVTRVDDNTFSLDGSTGNGAYTTGGTWHASGLYGISIDATTGNGFASGANYSILVSYAISSAQQAQLMTFQVS